MFDLREHPSGPSATTRICPRGEKLGEFIDNVAHSYGKYGLRIFDTLVPKKYPCLASGPENPPITAEFKNFLSYSN